MAEGFINVEGGGNREEVGEYYFNELINRSMIQPVGTSYDRRVEACRVHDMILDIIISKSVEENFITLLGNEKNTSVQQHKARRLSIDYNDRTYCMEPSTFTLSQVRSLTIFGNAEQMTSLAHFRLLRVLDLQHCVNMENHHLNNIGRLVWLKYLKLPRSTIDLPEQIGELQYLETLDTSDAWIERLPTSIVSLHQLVYLLVNSFCQVNFSDGIGNMHALQELSFVNVSSSSVNLIQELGSLTKLRILHIELHLVGGHIDIETSKNILVSSLSKLVKSKLRSLTIQCCGSNYPLEFLLDSWSPPPNLLQNISLGIVRSVVSFSRILEWMASLHDLTSLDISVKQMREDDMQLLGELSALLSLNLFSAAGP